ncbi:MAG: tetratricopeptide repeat protein, partial [Salinisphaera sp.]|nr:tetratricopeptide repeat protein [Salinisphaera sp.]
MAREESHHDVESDTERLALTLSQGLELAQKLLRRKQFDEAERLYRTILDHWPDEPDALHYLGVLQ